ncbi:MAG: hypothetical protein AAGD09_25565 [Cyanobacteria bacterium P01_F01_bin.56]
MRLTHRRFNLVRWPEADLAPCGAATLTAIALSNRTQMDYCFQQQLMVTDRACPARKERS